MTVTGRVKWFDPGRGYGFVLADDGGGDVLLHVNVLKAHGISAVGEGAEVCLAVQITPRGRQATEVIGIAAPPETAEADPLPAGDGPLEPARVKWFDKGRGFGFVNVFARPGDIFLHMEVLRRFGYAEVASGDVVAVRTAPGPRGEMVIEVRSWDYVLRLVDPPAEGSGPDG